MGVRLSPGSVAVKVRQVSSPQPQCDEYGDQRLIERNNEMASKTFAGLIAILVLSGCAERPKSMTDNELPAVSRKLNSWLDSDKPALLPTNPDAAKQNVPAVHDMVGALEDRLADNPDDMKGWSLLAQSYAFIGRMDDAQSAADRAIALGADPEQMRARILSAHTSSER